MAATSCTGTARPDPTGPPPQALWDVPAPDTITILGREQGEEHFTSHVLGNGAKYSRFFGMGDTLVYVGGPTTVGMAGSTGARLFSAPGGTPPRLVFNPHGLRHVAHGRLWLEGKVDDAGASAIVHVDTAIGRTGTIPLGGGEAVIHAGDSGFVVAGPASLRALSLDGTELWRNDSVGHMDGVFAADGGAFAVALEGDTLVVKRIGLEDGITGETKRIAMPPVPPSDSPLTKHSWSLYDVRAGEAIFASATTSSDSAWSLDWARGRAENLEGFRERVVRDSYVDSVWEQASPAYSSDESRGEVGRAPNLDRHNLPDIVEVVATIGSKPTSLLLLADCHGTDVGPGLRALPPMPVGTCDDGRLRAFVNAERDSESARSSP